MNIKTGHKLTIITKKENKGNNEWKHIQD